MTTSYRVQWRKPDNAGQSGIVCLTHQINQDFKDYAMSNFIVGENVGVADSELDIDNDHYFSEDELDAEEMGEVSNEVFDLLLFPDDDFNLNTPYLKSPESP